MEKTLEQLAIENEKAAVALQAASEKLESAQKELATNPEDGALKKTVRGLTLWHTKALEKAEAAQKALQDAQDENGDGDNLTENSGEKTPKDENDGAPDQNAGDTTSGGNDGEPADVKKIRIRCRSKTGKPSYFRAGLRFTPVDTEYEVSEEVAEILKNDPWLDGRTIE